MWVWPHTGCALVCFPSQKYVDRVIPFHTWWLRKNSQHLGSILEDFPTPLTGCVLPCLLPLGVSFCPRGGERKKVEGCSNPEVTGIGMSFGKSRVISPFLRAFETCPDLSKYEITQWVFPEEFGDTKELGHLTALLPLFFPPTPLSCLLAGFPPVCPFLSYWSPLPLLFCPFSYRHLSSPLSCPLYWPLDPPLFLIPRPPSKKTIWPLSYPCTLLPQCSRGCLCSDLRTPE